MRGLIRLVIISVGLLVASWARREDRRADVTMTGRPGKLEPTCDSSSATNLAASAPTEGPKSIRSATRQDVGTTNKSAEQGPICVRAPLGDIGS